MTDFVIHAHWYDIERWLETEKDVGTTSTLDAAISIATGILNRGGCEVNIFQSGRSVWCKSAF